MTDDTPFNNSTSQLDVWHQSLRGWKQARLTISSGFPFVRSFDYYVYFIISKHHNITLAYMQIMKKACKNKPCAMHTEWDYKNSAKGSDN